MQIERDTIAQMSIQDFAVEQGLIMEIHERATAQGDPMRYYAHFKHVEVKDGGCLASVHGNGATQPQAINDYARKISLKRIAVGAYTEQRRDLDVPRLIVEGAPYP